jgi:hypothetical protein
MPNDLCDNAVTVTCGQTVTGNTNNSTIDTPPACGLNFPRFGVWYRFVGTGQAVTLSTCNATTNYDSQIGVFSGSCSALTCVAGNDNDAACTAGGRKSTVTFNSTAGTTYYIWVTGAVSARGNFSLSISCAGSVGVANDACANAISMSCNSTVSGATTGATSDAVGTCTTTLNTAPGVWYSFVGNGASVTVSTCNPGTNYDTKLGVFSGSCGALTCIGGNDDTTAPECVLPATGFNRKSRVTFQSTAGTTYYVLVTGFGTAAGNFELSVTCATAPPPVSFNECAGAITLTPGATCVPTSGTNVGATQSVAPITCDGFTSNSALDVWYKFTATQATHAVIVNGGTTFDAVVDVRSGACNGTTIGCSDDQILSGASEVVLLNSLTAGQTYLIRIYGWFGATGNFTVCVTNGVTTLSELTDGVAAGNDVLGTITNEVVVGNVYPNPVQTELAYINIATPQDETATIQIVDQMGRIVRSMNTPLAQGANKVDLNLDGLATGAYFAAINIGGQMFRKMIVINR